MAARSYRLLFHAASIVTLSLPTRTSRYIGLVISKSYWMRSISSILLGSIPLAFTYQNLARQHYHARSRRPSTGKRTPVVEGRDEEGVAVWRAIMMGNAVYQMLCFAAARLGLDRYPMLLTILPAALLALLSRG